MNDDFLFLVFGVSLTYLNTKLLATCKCFSPESQWCVQVLSCNRTELHRTKEADALQMEMQ